MQLSFGTAAEISTAFAGALTYGGLVVLIGAGVVGLLAWDQSRKVPLRLISVLALVAFIAAASIAYETTAARFFALETKGSQLLLRFAGPFSREVLLSGRDVQTVLFGMPGKSDRNCYIRVVLKSGSSYRSSDRYDPVKVCQGLRLQILNALEQHGDV
ncbi:MAG: hypothetical protein U1E84_01665 [Rhodoferax sp.]|jgi:hypothetical protein